MPDWPTCEEAIVEAESELNPYTAYCTPEPVRRLKAVTPRARDWPILLNAGLTGNLCRYQSRRTCLGPSCPDALGRSRIVLLWVGEAPEGGPTICTPS
jgi:hypothetical protein